MTKTASLNSPPVLRRATPADAAVALAWSPTMEVLHRWAGSNVRWPTTPESFWEEINTVDATTFALTASDSIIVGFGQVRYRDQTYGHLARIIVSPHQRGRGFGRLLCSTLMREAPALHPITAYSLYVFDDNTPAIRLYESLGYLRHSIHPSYSNLLLMLAPLSAVDTHC